MKITNPKQRLKGFWGKVDNRHIRLISEYVSGHNILDMGCGYGTTTNYINSVMKLNCIGIDFNNSDVEYCKKEYNSNKFIQANAENLPFEDNYFDTIILRDALHHFVCEADFNLVKKEMLRVGKKNCRIIFFDPNVNIILRTMRKLVFHKDAECNYEEALRITEDMGLKIVHKSFNTVFSLPLSGGYVGLVFVPDIKLIHNIILFSEKIIEKLINRILLGRYVCWRYLIVSEIK